jgi:hypothetical protein
MTGANYYGWWMRKQLFSFKNWALWRPLYLLCIVCAHLQLSNPFSSYVMAKTWFSIMYFTPNTGHFTVPCGPDLVRGPFRGRFLYCPISSTVIYTVLFTHGSLLLLHKHEVETFPFKIEKKTFSAQSKARMMPPPLSTCLIPVKHMVKTFTG